MCWGRGLGAVQASVSGRASVPEPRMLCLPRRGEEMVPWGGLGCGWRDLEHLSPLGHLIPGRQGLVRAHV